MNRRRVERLPEHVANQIAAGEVVARPSSVVKELVENALDAEAQLIVVAIEAGGIGLVRVVDDGVGMDRDDARSALERHATSKLRSADDLRTLMTLGFRGEALPSIASVSRFMLKTRTREDDEGTELSVEGNGDVRLKPCGAPVGTTIEVRDLFFNVPARRKFLRALGTESAHVAEALRETAFAHPDVQFELWRDGRLHRRWLRAGSIEERARDILDDTATLRVNERRGPLHIEAYLSPPERVKSGATGLTLLVNRRPVQDRALARAVAAAYGDRIERGKYPLGLVALTLPTEECDVNVHPQKAEVRFSEPRAVCDAVYGAVQRALGTPVVNERSDLGPHAAGPSREHVRAIDAPRPWGRSHDGHAGFEAREPWAWSGAREGAATPATRPTTPALPPSTPAARPSALLYVATVEGCLLARSVRSLLFIDTTRARARVLRRDAMRELEGGRLHARPLLFPLRLDVGSDAMSRLEAAGATLERLGFDLTASGPRTLTLHGVAHVFEGASAEDLVRVAASASFADDTSAAIVTFVDQASAIAARADSRSAQALLDAWFDSLDGADPRDAAETKHHIALSTLAESTRRDH